MGVVLRPLWEPITRDTPLIGSRQAVGALLERHPDQIKRWCTPIACDIRTKAPMYDVDEAAKVLRERRRILDQEWRRRRVACA